MFSIGLTGNIGSGKSTVASLMKDMGAVVIDADELAKAATEDPKVLELIKVQLGQELVKNGKLDRSLTAKKVFSDKNALKTLNGIIHPWIAKKRSELVNELRISENPPKFIVHDIPLLYEIKMVEDFDVVIVVYASLETRIKRIMARSDLTVEEIRLRDSRQIPLEQKLEWADIVIENEGDLEALKKEVWSKLDPLFKNENGA